MLPVVVVVVAAAADASSIEVRALATTAESVLGPGDRVEVVPSGAAPDAQRAWAEQAAAARGGDAVVVVRWLDAARERAVLEVRRGRADWLVRTLDFVPADAPEERGRALGFAVASMLPPASSAPAPTPDAAPIPVPTAPHRAIFDVVFSGSVGLGGEGATAAGGRLGGGVRVLGPVWLRSGVAYRVGPLGTATASTTALDVGIAAYAFEPGVRPLALGARVDVGALRHAVALPGGGPHGDRWVGAVDVMVEGSWSVVRHAALVLAMGPELALGEVHVLVDGVQVATIPTWRLRAEVGLQIGF